MAKKSQTEVKKCNKAMGIMLVVFANLVLSAAIAQIVVSNYVRNNSEQIMNSLQAYADSKEMADSKNTEQELKKLDAEVRAGTKDPFIGNPNGQKIVIEFFDYNCGYCKHVFPEIKKLIESDKDVKVVMKELPILGPNSQVVSMAAVAVFAKQPEKYYIFHQNLMEFKGQKTEETILQIAKDSGVSFDLASEMQKDEYVKFLEGNRELAQKLGINGTPSFVVRARLIPGAVDARTIEKLLNAPAAK